MAETTRNHIFSKEISHMIIAAKVLAPISIEKLSASDFSYERKSAFSFMSRWTWELKFFLEWHLGEFHDVKKHCISFPTKSLIFCKLLLFFQNKARIANSL